MSIRNIAWAAVAVFTWFGIYQFVTVINSVLLS
jgi:hypothetical protein